MLSKVALEPQADDESVLPVMIEKAEGDTGACYQYQSPADGEGQFAQSGQNNTAQGIDLVDANQADNSSKATCDTHGHDSIFDFDFDQRDSQWPFYIESKCEMLSETGDVRVSISVNSVNVIAAKCALQKALLDIIEDSELFPVAVSCHDSTESSARKTPRR